MGLFDRVTVLLQRGIGLCWLRHNLLASNLANVETPGYRPRDIDFAKEMERAAAEGYLPMARTHPDHLPPLQGSSPSLILRGGWGNPDGNKVDLEGEMVRLAENYLQYLSLLRMLQEKLSMVKYSISEGGTQ